MARHIACLIFLRNLTTDKENIYTYLLLRLDLQIEDTKIKSIFLTDLKCPMDLTDNLQRANDINLNKYRNLRDNIKEILPRLKVVLDIFIVAVFGSWTLIMIRSYLI